MKFGTFTVMLLVLFAAIACSSGSINQASQKAIQPSPPVEQSANAFSPNPDDVQKLLDTKQCPDCDLKGADLSNADLNGANLQAADLRGANLSKANLSKVNLIQTDLRAANLDKANLSQAKLVGAQLSWTGENATKPGSYGRTTLRQADLSGANLITSYLRGADLSEANLSRAYLHAADLSQATLDKAVLQKHRVVLS